MLNEYWRVSKVQKISHSHVCKTTYFVEDRSGDHARFVDENLTNLLKECSRLQPNPCSDTSKVGVHGDDGSTGHLRGPTQPQAKLIQHKSDTFLPHLYHSLPNGDQVFGVPRRSASTPGRTI